MKDKMYDVLKFVKGKGTRIVFLGIAGLIIVVGKERATDYIAYGITVITVASQLTSNLVANAKEQYYALEDDEE